MAGKGPRLDKLKKATQSPSPLGHDTTRSSVPDGESIENQTIHKNKELRSKLLQNPTKTRPPLAPRPDYTSVGEKVQLLANCFPIQLIGKLQLYQYGVVVERKDPIDTEDDDSEQGNTPDEQLVQQTGQLSLEPGDANNGQTAGDDEDEDRHPKGAKLGQILYHFFNKHDELRNMMNNGTMASDFSGTIITTAELGKAWLEASGIELTYRGQKSKYREDKYTVTIKKPKTITSEDTTGHLTGSDQQLNWNDINRGAEMIQALNIMYRNSTKWKSMNVDVNTAQTKAIIGSKTYSLTEQHHHLSTGVVAINGFFSSIRPAAGRLFMNVNNTCGPFYKAWTLRDLFDAMSGDLNRFHAFVRGITVRLSHRNEHDSDQKPIRTLKTVRGLAHQFDGQVPQGNLTARRLEHPPRCQGNKEGRVEFGARCGQVEFWERKKEPKGAKGTEKPNAPKKNETPRKEEGKYVTVEQYFKKKYPELRPPIDPNDYAINVGTQSRPEYVPMALCTIVPGQSYRATLAAEEITNMIDAARKEPAPNADEILKKAGKVLDFKSNVLQINTDQLLTVPGQQLKPPAVAYGQSKPPIGKGSWGLRDIKHYTRSGTFPRWGAIAVTNRGRWDIDNARNSESVRTQKMRARGLAPRGTNEQPDIKPMIDVGNFKDDETLYKTLSNPQYREIKLWLVFVPENFSSEQYKCLKRVCDLRLGVHTCCVNTKNNLSGLQYWDNVLLKVNLKLGGDNQSVTMPDDKLIDFSKTMVVGLDVTHPAPGAQATEQSIAAMVASCDKSLGQWPATLARQQQSKDEVVFNEQGIVALLTPHLERWKAKHKVLPENILVYRDGVSEGQYEQVVTYEYEHIKKACKKLYGIKLPNITIVIVGKRHHMRFYKKGPDGKATRDRTPAGTLVDRRVTSQYLWEFYLQAHHALAGTPRPAHYVVLIDEIFSKIKESTLKCYPSVGNAQNLLATVTHALSYAMGRSTTAVGVCAPAFLADKACDRARVYGAGNPQVHTLLKDRMFYI